MTIENEIMINKYGQGFLTLENLLESYYIKISPDFKREYLNDILNLIIQSKPIVEDIPSSIKLSQLKETYTPCVLLKKGLKYSHLSRIINLPNNELDKAAVLLLSLFKIAYERRFLQESNITNKWWYKDLSGTIENIKKNLISEHNF